MGKLSLEIPEEVRAALRLPPGEIEKELRKELALALYQRQVLSLGKARELAQMTRWEFEKLLRERRIPRHYTELEAHLSAPPPGNRLGETFCDPQDTREAR